MLFEFAAVGGETAVLTLHHRMFGCIECHLSSSYARQGRALEPVAPHVHLFSHHQVIALQDIDTVCRPELSCLQHRFLLLDIGASLFRDNDNIPRIGEGRVDAF